MFLKVITMILCCIMIIPVISACSDRANDKSAESISIVSDDNQIADTEIPDNLPDSNFDGYTFRVLTIVESIGIEEADGEVLNDVEFARDVVIEERFNVQIEAEYHENYLDVTKQLKKAVAAQTDDYDMVFIHMVDGASIASSGHYYPINDLEYINLEKIWWDKDIENGFRIGGKLFLSAGDILPDTLLRTSCMAFNKNLFDNYNLTYPYQLAYDDKWTLDELSLLTKDITKDLNGDGQIKEADDLFGLTSWYLDSPYSFYYGAGGTIIKKDENDMPELNLDIEKNLAIYMKIYDVVITNNSNYHTDIGTYINSYSTFYEGRALFCEIALAHLPGDAWRNMEQDYGIVPIPKFDTDQKNYLGFVNGAAAMMGVPITITDPERTSILIEGLAAESYKGVTPALYEIVAKTKHTRDEESSDMIDIIIRNRVFDIGYSHLLSNGISTFVRDLLASGKTDVASHFAKNEKSLTKALEKIVAAYEENT